MSLLHFLFFRLSKPSSFSWTPCSRCSLISAERGGITTSLDLLAMPLQMQPILQLAALAVSIALCAAGRPGCRGHCCLGAQRVLHQPSSCFSAKLLSILLAPSLWAYSIPAAEMLGVSALISGTLYSLLLTN